MTQAVDRDLKRFRQIVRGKIRGDLKRYVNHGEMVGRRGRETVSIPVPSINIPRFQHGKRGSGGTGQGEGEEGQPVARGDDGETGIGPPGSESSGHVREVEVTLDELAAMLGDELGLPRIEPRGEKNIDTQKDRYTSISQTGPNSLRHFKRTYKQALKRQIASGEYNPREPVIIPGKEDERFRSWKTQPQPQANAAIVYLMDVSGSMTDDQKAIVRTESFWIDTWLASQYDGLERRFIVHDAQAHEVDEDTFYRIREAGGTRISSAYRKAAAVIERDFPVSEWNVYLFQFSDGDNWGEDNRECLKILTDELLPAANLFCYGQVESPYGSGDFIRELVKLQAEHDHLITSEIANKDAIYDSIRTFLSSGR